LGTELKGNLICEQLSGDSSLHWRSVEESYRAYTKNYYVNIIKYPEIPFDSDQVKKPVDDFFSVEFF
jgi:hypothetical protein